MIPFRSAGTAMPIPPTGLLTDDQGRARCSWCGTLPEYVAYHDDEWGRPVVDDRRLFEKICLEGFQCGLSWLTILRKREHFREAFDDFDFVRVARYTPARVERLLSNAGIVRHRGKIASTINNAQRARELADEQGSLAHYFWGWQPGVEMRPPRMTFDVLRSLSTTPQSAALSKDLKRRGWSFVGPTTVYAFMQATGLVNDHLDGCHVRAAVEEARRERGGHIFLHRNFRDLPRLGALDDFADGRVRARRARGRCRLARCPRRSLAAMAAARAGRVSAPASIAVSGWPRTRSVAGTLGRRDRHRARPPARRRRRRGSDWQAAGLRRRHRPHT